MRCQGVGGVANATLARIGFHEMTNIIDLLERKHDKDLFVAECLMGPSGSPRLDGWALKRTWSPLTAIGYEIKVTRSDFLRDNKWPTYLDACHQLYFVCPSGVIQPDELPGDVGLLWVAKTGTRLFVKRKATFRDIDLPIDLLIHVLMCRTVIVGDMWQANSKAANNRQRNAQRWRRWLDDREKNRELGDEVRGMIAKLYAEIEVENVRLKATHAGYETMRRCLADMGFDPEVPVSQWGLRERITEALGTLPKGLEGRARNIATELDSFAEHVAKLRRGWEARAK